MANNPNNLNLKSKSAICPHEASSSAKTAVQGWNFEWPGDYRGDQQMDRPQLSKPGLMEAITKFDLQDCENQEDKVLVEDLSKLKQSMIGQPDSPATTSPSTPRTDARNNLLEMSGHKVPVLQPVPPRKIPRPPSVPKSGRNTPQRWGRKIRSPILPLIIKGISIIDASKEVSNQNQLIPTPPKSPTPQPSIVEATESDLTRQNEGTVSIDRNSIFPIVYSPTFLPPLREESKHILRMVARGQKVPRMERNNTLLSVDPPTSSSGTERPNIQYLTGKTFQDVHPTTSAPASMKPDDTVSKDHQPDLGSLKIDTRASFNDASPVTGILRSTASIKRCSSMDPGSKQVHLRVPEKVPRAHMHQAVSASELGMNLSTKKIIPPISTKPTTDNNTVLSDSSSDDEESVDFLTLTKRCLPKINAATEAKVREKVQRFRDITEESLQRVMNRMDFDCFSDEWSFPEDTNLYRAVLFRNHVLNHGIIYQLHKRRAEMTKDVEMMESFQNMTRRRSQVMTLEHLENGEIKEHNQLVIFDKNKGKTLVHKAQPLKLGKSLLSVIDRCKAKAKKLHGCSTKKSDVKLNKPAKSVSQQYHASKPASSQQCNIGPPNGFVNVPIRIQNLPPSKVSAIGPRKLVEKLPGSKLTSVATTTTQIPHPPASNQSRLQPIKTINETITMKSFNQSIHGTKLSRTKHCGSLKAYGKRTG